MLPPPDNSTCYARSCLSGHDLAFYDALVAALQAGQFSVRMNAITKERALDLSMLVMHDHPEFYWVVSSVEAGGFGNKLTMVKHLRPDSAFEQVLTQKSRAALRGLPASCSEYTIAKTAYAAVVSMANYDENDRADDRRFIQSHGMWGVFGKGLAVCDGYSAALQYLLQHEGIQSYRITGHARNEYSSGAHAWVLARIDGEYYHIDPTWGNMARVTAALDPNPANANFDYFCLCDKEIRGTHCADEKVPIPACTSTLSNYYRQEGFILQTWDMRTVVDMIVRQKERGCGYYGIRAATAKVYKTLLDVLVDGDEFWQLITQVYQSVKEPMPENINFTYQRNDRFRTVHIIQDDTH